MVTGRSKPIPAFNEYDSTEDCLHPITNLTMSPRRPDKQFGTTVFCILQLPAIMKKHLTVLL